jgi:hypothetical protein
LLYVGEELAAVVGYCVCEPYHAQQQQSGLKLELASVNRS